MSNIKSQSLSIVRRIVTRLLFVSLLQAVFVFSAFSQAETESWLRVFTDEGSVVEVNRFGLVLEPNNVIRAQFRTVFSKPDSIPGKPDLKYKTRIDSIHFNVATQRYRVSESNFLDKSDKSIFTVAPSKAADWKPISGRTANRLFSASTQLQPFGYWKVASYQYASGEGPFTDDPKELRDLIGSSIVLKLNHLFIGSSNCTRATFEWESVTDSILRSRVGMSLKDLGFNSDNVNVIKIGCRSNDNYPPTVLVILQSPTKGKLLWDGVFFDIERPGNPFSP